jgi:hypothetical protein
MPLLYQGSGTMGLVDIQVEAGQLSKIGFPLDKKPLLGGTQIERDAHLIQE